MGVFMIWTIFGVFFIGLGMYCLTSKRRTPVGFWANAKVFQVEDAAVKGYNNAMGRLWMVYGIVFIMIGLPLVRGQNSPLIILTILGTILEIIALMIYYTLVIEKKYRKR